MRSSWWRVTQPAKASTRKYRAWGMAGGYMAQTRPSPTLSRGCTRLGRFLAPDDVATWSGFVYTAFVVDVFALGSASATA